MKTKQEKKMIEPTPVGRYAQQVISKEIRAIESIPIDESYDIAISMLVATVHNGSSARRAGKVVTSGMGKAGQIALNIATTLNSTGTPAVYLHPSEAQHGDLGVIEENDIMILLSNSGKTREVVELCMLTNNLWENIPKIVITGDMFSDLAKQADICLHTGGHAEVCPLGLTPTTSTTTMTVIGDVIVTGLMQAIGFTKDDYAKRHHGGYLGQVARA
jgi:arabinose-5-phosphate isomerase